MKDSGEVQRFEIKKNKENWKDYQNSRYAKMFKIQDSTIKDDSLQKNELKTNQNTIENGKEMELSFLDLTAQRICEQPLGIKNRRTVFQQPLHFARQRLQMEKMVRRRKNLPIMSQRDAMATVFCEKELKYSNQPTLRQKNLSFCLTSRKVQKNKSSINNFAQQNALIPNNHSLDFKQNGIEQKLWCNNLPEQTDKNLTLFVQNLKNREQKIMYPRKVSHHQDSLRNRKKRLQQQFTFSCSKNYEQPLSFREKCQRNNKYSEFYSLNNLKQRKFLLETQEKEKNSQCGKSKIAGIQRDKSTEIEDKNADIKKYYQQTKQKQKNMINSRFLRNRKTVYKL